MGTGRLVAVAVWHDVAQRRTRPRQRRNPPGSRHRRSSRDNPRCLRRSPLGRYLRLRRQSPFRLPFPFARFWRSFIPILPPCGKGTHCLDRWSMASVTAYCPRWRAGRWLAWNRIRTVVVWLCGGSGVLGCYFAVQAFQADEDRARGYRTLVATHGPKAVLLAGRVYQSGRTGASSWRRPVGFRGCRWLDWSSPCGLIAGWRRGHGSQMVVTNAGPAVWRNGCSSPLCWESDSPMSITLWKLPWISRSPDLALLVDIRPINP